MLSHLIDRYINWLNAKPHRAEKLLLAPMVIGILLALCTPASVVEWYRQSDQAALMTGLGILALLPLYVIAFIYSLGHRF